MGEFEGHIGEIQPEGIGRMRRTVGGGGRLWCGSW